MIKNSLKENEHIQFLNEVYGAASTCIAVDYRPLGRLSCRVEPARLILNESVSYSETLTKRLGAIGFEAAALASVMPAPQRSIAPLIAARLSLIASDQEGTQKDDDCRVIDFLTLGSNVALSHDSLEYSRHAMRKYIATPWDDVPLSAKSAERILALWPFIYPAHRYLTEGGDERLAVDEHTRANRYLCVPSPMLGEGFCFSSTTASPLSLSGWNAAQKAQRHFIADFLTHGDMQNAQRRLSEAVRSELARLGFAPKEDAIILAASGTECEFVGLTIAQKRAEERAISVILVAPEETGSGVPLATQARHFATTCARGGRVSKGAIIEGLRTPHAYFELALRDANGHPRDAGAVDRECNDIVSSQIAKGHHVVVHCLDAAKTGLTGPSDSLLKSLAERFEGSLTVLVDACQARISVNRIHEHLEQQHIIMLTGSKFFAGPPFSGAVIVPPPMIPLIAGDAIPIGLEQYFSNTEWPMARQTNILAQRSNLALSYRWHAALAGIRSFRAVSTDVLYERLRELNEILETTIKQHGFAEPVALPSRALSSLGRDKQDWSRINSIFPFFLSKSLTIKDYLNYQEARILYRSLTRDLTQLFPHAQEIASYRALIGQPVELLHRAPSGNCLCGALRIAVSAQHLVIDEARGETWTMRRENFRMHLETTMEKMRFLLQNWSALPAQE